MISEHFECKDCHSRGKKHPSPLLSPSIAYQSAPCTFNIPLLTGYKTNVKQTTNPTTLRQFVCVQI